MNQVAAPKLLDQVRNAIRVRHYSIRTEEAYVGWVRRYVVFHGKRHPAELGAAEVSAFLTHLAVRGTVAASTQNQALNALVFLYRHVVEHPLPDVLDDVARAKKPARLPVVLTRDEVRRVLSHLEGRTPSSPGSCTAPGCGCWRRSGCGSRTWTGARTRSWCATSRARRTA